MLVLPVGDENGGPVRSFAAPVWHDDADPDIKHAVELLAPATVSTVRSAPSADDAIAAAVICAQIAVLGQPDQVSWLPGRLMAVTNTLRACFRSIGKEALLPTLDVALVAALKQGSAAALRDWLTQNMELHGDGTHRAPLEPAMASVEPAQALPSGGDADRKFGRRADDVLAGPKTLKVDQEKIDRLMNLIGEMVVAKNGLPYLAGRAEAVFGVRELAREIKTLYAVINRIAEEMQDAIMQVRMMPVSFVFQRFPRLVRDISRKLGKEVDLVLEGEQTEADKNIIEALADPLIHIVRNSLDHGIELPEARRAAGKPAQGRLVIRASQEADRVVIDNFEDMNQYYKTRFEIVTRHNEELAADIAEVLGQIQYQDVVRQCIERIRAAIAQRNTCLQNALGLADQDASVLGQLPQELARVLEDYRTEEDRHRHSARQLSENGNELKIELF